MTEEQLEEMEEAPVTFSEEQLNELTELSALFFSPEDIMISLEIPYHKIDEFKDILILQKDNPIYLAYHTGRLRTEISLRNAILKASLNGSNPAQNSMLDFRNRS